MQQQKNEGVSEPIVSVQTDWCVRLAGPQPNRVRFSSGGVEVDFWRKSGASISMSRGGQEKSVKRSEPQHELLSFCLQSKHTSR